MRLTYESSEIKKKFEKTYNNFGKAAFILLILTLIGVIVAIVVKKELAACLIAVTAISMLVIFALWMLGLDKTTKKYDPSVYNIEQMLKEVDADCEVEEPYGSSVDYILNEGKLPEGYRADLVKEVFKVFGHTDEQWTLRITEEEEADKYLK